MAGPDRPRADGADDDLGAALADLDAAEAAALEALGDAVGAVLRGAGDPELDVATVDAIWTRVEPEIS